MKQKHLGVWYAPEELCHRLNAQLKIMNWRASGLRRPKISSKKGSTMNACVLECTSCEAQLRATMCPTLSTHTAKSRKRPAQRTFAAFINLPSPQKQHKDAGEDVILSGSLPNGEHEHGYAGQPHASDYVTAACDEQAAGWQRPHAHGQVCVHGCTAFQAYHEPASAHVFPLPRCVPAL
eukprot:354547-Chlamydomonas_euryale.AAC.4